jgi:integrase/recombinase XerD
LTRRAAPPARQRGPVDRFIDALWIEDGLAPADAGGLPPRPELLYAWLAARGRQASTKRAASPTCWPTCAQAHASTRATTANRRLTVFKRYFRWAAARAAAERRPDAQAAGRAQPLRVPKT